MAISSDARTKEDEMSYVYVLRRGDLCKIGRSVNPWKRAEDIASQAGLTDIELVATFDVDDDAASVERMAHSALAFARQRGEWFLVTAEYACEVIDYIVPGAKKGGPLYPPSKELMATHNAMLLQALAD